MLKRMLELVLHTAGAADVGDNVPIVDRPARQARLYVRLTPGDRQLLRARSAARCLALATYASILLRAHLRAVTPLPDAELRAIRQSTRELAAIGRDLNQIAYAVHQGGFAAGVTQGNLLGLLKAVRRCACIFAPTLVPILQAGSLVMPHRRQLARDDMSPLCLPGKR
jgi:hypothetical protein